MKFKSVIYISVVIIIALTIFYKYYAVNMDILRKHIDELEEKIIVLEKENNRNVSSEKDIVHELRDEVKSDVDDSIQDKPYYVYYLENLGKRIPFNYSFQEVKIPKLVEVRQISSENATLHLFPYDASELLSTEAMSSLVDVLAYVNNADGEEWAFVRVQFEPSLGGLTLGYMKLEYLDNVFYENHNIPDCSFGGISIGSNIEKVVALMGNEYSFEKKDYTLFIEYEYIKFRLNPTDYTVYEIYVEYDNFSNKKLVINGNEYYDNEILIYCNENLETLDEEIEVNNGDMNRYRYIEYSLNNKYIIALTLTDDINEKVIINDIFIMNENN